MTGLVPPRSQLNALQILRAVAAASVVYCHLLCLPNFGSFGVDIFFVLSGFVIAMVAEQRPDAGRFALHRLTRVVPLYWLLTLSVFVLAALRPALLNSTTADAGNLIRSLFFIPYFKESGVLQPMLAVGWTLNYEMFFYLLVTCMLLLGRRFVFGGTAALVLLSYAIGHLLPADSALGYFWRTPLLFEFVLGMLAYRLKDQAWLMRVPMAVAAIVAVLLYAAMAVLEQSSEFGKLAMFGLPSFGLVLMLLRLEPFLSRGKAWVRWGVFLGDASYAIYLSHFYVVEGMRKLVAPHLPLLAPTLPLGAAVTLGMALAAGAVCYVLLDRPLVRLARTCAAR